MGGRDTDIILLDENGIRCDGRKINETRKVSIRAGVLNNADGSAYIEFGENKIQEAQSKWPNFKERFEDIELHIIGPLQTNKTRAAMELADYIHTLDRTKLATAIARIAQDLGKCPGLFVQVNTGDEPQKSGVSPKETQAFVKECLDMDLPVKGLMCIPPVNEEASLHFALLKNIGEDCGLSYLSMGMSSDFEKAISFGATHIRVGSAIFGDRVKSPGQ